MGVDIVSVFNPPNEDANEESKILTVDTLLKRLTVLSKNGLGDLKIKCNDSFLYEDEIVVDVSSDELCFHGYLYNQPIFDAVVKLKADIRKACDSFFEFENEWGRDNGDGENGKH